MKIRTCTLIVLGAIASIGVICEAVFSSPPVLPEFSEVRARWQPSDAQLLDRNGDPLDEIRIDRHGRRLAWTPLNEISPALQQAVIASEDHRFPSHHGVDVISYRISGKTEVKIDNITFESMIWRRLQ